MAQGHAFDQPDSQHKRGQAATSITDKWQGQPRDWHDIHIHADVDRPLEEDQGGNSVSDDCTRYITPQ